MLLLIPVFVISKDLPDVIEKIDKSSVTVGSNSGEYCGSGVSIIRGNEVYILTCCHIINDVKVITFLGTKFTFIKPQSILRVELDDKQEIIKKHEYKAEIFKYSTNIDVCILKVLQPDLKIFSNIEFYNSLKILPRGTKTILVANFLDYQSTPGITGSATGTIGELSRKVRGSWKADIIYDSSITGGCSGAGVFNNNAEYIGLVFGKFSSNSLLYTPIREIRKWTDEQGISWLLDKILDNK